LRIEFEFFDLEERIQELRKKAAALDTGTTLQITIEGMLVTGEITTYHPNRTGHISCAQRTNGFFFHVSDIDSIMDAELAPILEKLRRDSPNGRLINPPISVEFEDGGITREGASRPRAMRIRRTSKPA
jgi:hypothetical protein